MTNRFLYLPNHRLIKRQKKSPYLLCSSLSSSTQLKPENQRPARFSLRASFQSIKTTSVVSLPCSGLAAGARKEEKEKKSCAAFGEEEDFDYSVIGLGILILSVSGLGYQNRRRLGLNFKLMSFGADPLPDQTKVFESNSI